LETIRKFGDHEALDATVDDAFPGRPVAGRKRKGVVAPT